MWVLLLISVALLSAPADGEARPRQLKMAFTGDVSPSWRPPPSLPDRLTPEESPLRYLAPFLERADLAVANMEGVFAAEDPGYAVERYNLWAPPQWAWIFAPAGVDVVSTANNHALDARAEGVLATRARLEATGVHVIGTGADPSVARRPYIWKLGGDRCVAVLPATTKCNLPVPEEGPAALALYPPEREEELAAEVRGAATRCAFVVVYIHWGPQYVDVPPLEIRRLGRRLLHEGADLVVGHHAHVLQGVEIADEGVIAYGLGNMVFKNATPPKSLTGVLLVTLDVGGAEPRIRAVELYPAVIRRSDYMPHPASPRERAAIVRRLREVSRPFETKVSVDGALVRFE